MARELKIRHDALGVLDLIVEGTGRSGLSGVHEEIGGMQVFRDATTGGIIAFGFLNFPLSYRDTVEQLRSASDLGLYDLPEAGISDGTLVEILDWLYDRYVREAAAWERCERCGTPVNPVLESVDLLDRRLTVHGLALYHCPVCGHRMLTEAGRMRLEELADQLRAEPLPALVVHGVGVESRWPVTDRVSR